MPYQPMQEPFVFYLYESPIRSIATDKKFFGGTYTTLMNYFWVLSFLYEVGAILGQARCSKLHILSEVLFSSDGLIANYPSMESYKSEARERLDKYRQRSNRDPNTFHEFVLHRELHAVTGRDLFDSLESFNRGKRNALKPFNREVRLEKETSGVSWNSLKEQVMLKVYLFTLEGIAFGSLFPELTEKMIREYYESIEISDKEWAGLRDSGYTSTKKARIKNFPEMKNLVMRLLAGYVNQYYPELAESLSLGRYKGDLFSYSRSYNEWVGTVKAIFFHQLIKYYSRFFEGS